MGAELARIAYELSFHALAEQGKALRELRARTGVLLAASSLTVLFLGDSALRDPSPRWLAIVALIAFVVSIGSCVYVLVPKRELVFSLRGAGVYEGLYDVRDDVAEAYRRLAVEILAFAALVGDKIFS